MSRFAHITTALVAGSWLLLATSAAFAQPSLSQTDWRRHNRSSLDESSNASTQNFAFEFRFGPYYPEVDEEFGETGPYTEVFNDNPQFYFGMELDWLPLHIPYIGSFGPGIGWGYTSTSTKAKITGTDRESGQDTSLTIMPMHLSAVGRFDGLMRETGIPVVPYIKFGIGLGLWTAGMGSDTATYDGVLGRGTSWGTHFALGLMLSLNWLDKDSSARLDDSLGINHVYFFGEFMDANLDGIGSYPQMHVGSSNWVLGLAFDM